jgi:hypothetical protein
MNPSPDEGSSKSGVARIRVKLALTLSHYKEGANATHPQAVDDKGIA